MADHRHVASIVLIVLVDILDTTPATAAAATAAQERSDAVVVLERVVMLRVMVGRAWWDDNVAANHHVLI
jgi:hypothetical protein